MFRNFFKFPKFVEVFTHFLHFVPIKISIIFLMVFAIFIPSCLLGFQFELKIRTTKQCHQPSPCYNIFCNQCNYLPHTNMTNQYTKNDGKFQYILQPSKMSLTLNINPNLESTHQYIVNGGTCSAIVYVFGVCPKCTGRKVYF